MMWQPFYSPTHGEEDDRMRSMEWDARFGIGGVGTAVGRRDSVRPRRRHIARA